ncbi:hypothetical protein [Methanobrevibacter sp.]|uniref:hypothetical protein n=1 Tax=Methanobrevibacter sp. TaxID=66852 RepID=UPI0025D3F7E9|nr:hypothetical protein [Methanobrevibacter sp.]MBQ2666528.1 hypothetical protein [Methanobrevibacter sp.]
MSKVRFIRIYWSKGEALLSMKSFDKSIREFTKVIEIIQDKAFPLPKSPRFKGYQ